MVESAPEALKQEKTTLNYKILVIDDSKEIRDLLGLVFRPEGYDVIEANSGRQALLKLTQETRPDLIFLDYQMEEMNGPEFLSELAHLHPEILKVVPIVMLTGNELDSIHHDLVSEVIGKQVGIGPLLAVAKRHLH